MSKNSRGVLIHGAGWVSTEHIKAFQQNPHTRVVALSSRSLNSCRDRAAEAGLEDVAFYDNFEMALQHEEVDIVSVCTPQHLHCENVVESARAGKHLVIEKPIANSVQEMRLMKEAVREAGVKSVVSFVLRWNPLFRTLKKMIADNVLGAPYYVEADYLSQVGSWWSGWNDARTVEHGVSAFLVGGCHAIDTLRWFAATGEFEAAMPLEVMAMSGGCRKGSRQEYNPLTNTWVDDAPPMEYDGLEVVLVRFSNGILGKASVNFDCVMPYRLPVRIFGDRGSVFDNRIWSHKFPGQKDWVEIPSILPDSSDVTHHPFQDQMDHFVDCIIEDRESHCNLEDAVKTHEIVFAAQESYRTGSAVKLPLVE